MRIEHIEQKLDETIQPGDVVSFEFSDKLAVEGLVVETEDGLEIQLDEQGEEYITELLPLAIMGAGLAWSAYDAYQAAKAVKAGEMTKGDLAKQVGTDLALSVAGGGVAKAAGKGYKYFRKWWKKNEPAPKKQPAPTNDIETPKSDPSAAPVSTVAKKADDVPAAPVSTVAKKADDVPVAPASKVAKKADDVPAPKAKAKTKKKRSRRGTNINPNSQGSDSNLSGWLAKYGPNAQLADDVSRLRKLAGLNESYIFEGVWSVPQDMSAVAELDTLFKNSIPANKAAQQVYNLTGSDDLFDDFYELEDMGADTDARPTIARWIERNMDLIADNTSDPEEVTQALSNMILPFVKEGPFVSESDKDDVKPHYMYKGDKEEYTAKLAKDEKDHEELADKGYDHDDPETKKIEEVKDRDVYDASEPGDKKKIKLKKAPWEKDEDDEDLDEAEYQGKKVSLNKPIRTGKDEPKKFKVYVKDGDRVKLVRFGHQGKGNEKTMRIKKSDPKRRKSFRARHNCSNPGPKTKARYWSCKAW